MKRFLSDLAAAVREVFHPEPWPEPDRDDTAAEGIARWIADHKHPDVCQSGCQCERGGEV